MLAIFFVAGVILSGSLAYQGLVHGRVKVSASKDLTGSAAKAAGWACAAFALLLLGLTAWAVLSALRP